jgi:hypothetical protein
MTAEYDSAVKIVNEAEDQEYLDFHARRLVEMAGNIIIGYLLIQDTMRDEDFMNTAEIFIKLGIAGNREKADYIKNSEIKDLGIYKY